ncbi:unnamed protein product, partial [Didymodactylos carnosus]
TNKSSYIQCIRESFQFVEHYFRTLFMDKDKSFHSTCIETLTPAKLVIELESSSKFLSSDEDRPLNDIAFFEPQTKQAVENQPLIISGFNGIYLHSKSTMTYAKDIRDRSLTMLVPTTGNRWHGILEHFCDTNKTNGKQRICYEMSI